MKKCCFVWMVDGSKNPFWWNRVAYSIDSLRKILPEDKADVRVLCFEEDGDPRVIEWLKRKFGSKIIVRVNDEMKLWAYSVYQRNVVTDFSPCILFRLLLYRFRELDYERIISVDADSEWVKGADKLMEIDNPGGVAMVKDPYWYEWSKRVVFEKLPPMGMLKIIANWNGDLQDPYYGGGLIVYDKAKITEETTEKIKRLVGLAGEFSFGWLEQDIINIATVGSRSVTDIDGSYDVFYGHMDLLNASLIQYAGSSNSVAKIDFDKKVQGLLRKEGVL